MIKEAEGITAKGVAEAEAIKAKGTAEAEALNKKADAMKNMVKLLSLKCSSLHGQKLLKPLLNR